MGASEGTDELAGLFPKLAAEGFEIVAPSTKRYNCIAFAAGDTHRWWDHNEQLLSARLRDTVEQHRQSGGGVCRAGFRAMP